MYETYRHLSMTRRGKVLVVAMDNPPVNTVTAEMHEELSRIFFDVDRDAEAAVVVLTGAGQAFTSGGDIKAMRQRLETGAFDASVVLMHEQREIVRGLLNLGKPLIARINGDAYGVGAVLATFADISFMLDTAKIADTHVKIGLGAGDGCSLIWPLLMGFNKAREYLFTGDALTGAEAAALGLVNHALPAGELDARVDQLADRLAGGATQAINATKRSVNLVLKKQLEALIDAHLGLETYTYFSQDHAEAVRAFGEKRKPVFRGR